MLAGSAALYTWSGGGQVQVKLRIASRENQFHLSRWFIAGEAKGRVERGGQDGRQMQLKLEFTKERESECKPGHSTVYQYWTVKNGFQSGSCWQDSFMPWAWWVLALVPAVLLLPSVTPRLSWNLAICCRNLLVSVNNKSLNFTESRWKG